MLRKFVDTLKEPSRAATANMGPRFGLLDFATRLQDGDVEVIDFSAEIAAQPGIDD